MRNRRWLERLSIGALACGLASGGAFAQVTDRSERRQQESQKTAPAPSGSGDTLSYEFKPYVETEGGYDSDPDNLIKEVGSAFLKMESGFKLSAQNKDQYYGLTLKGRYIDFVDLEPADFGSRTDFKAALDTSFNLSSAETLKLGTYFFRDFISPIRLDYVHSYADYTYDASDYKLRLLGKSHVEHNFDNDVFDPATDDFADFSTTRSRAFDFVRSDAQMNLLTFKTNTFQPYLILDASDINYYNQTTGATLNRDAREEFAIAGLRYQPNKNFRVDVGYRLSFRQFDEPTVGHKNTDYVDVNMFWQPVEDVKFTAIVERYFQEPNTSFGVADDVRAYGLTFDWKIAPQWRWSSSVRYTLEDAIADDARFKKWLTTASLTYDVNEHMEVFVSGMAKWVHETVDDTSYTRYKIGSGVRLKF